MLGIGCHTSPSHIRCCWGCVGKGSDVPLQDIDLEKLRILSLILTHTHSLIHARTHTHTHTRAHTHTHTQGGKGHSCSYNFQRSWDSVVIQFWSVLKSLLILWKLSLYCREARIWNLSCGQLRPMAPLGRLEPSSYIKLPLAELKPVNLNYICSSQPRTASSKCKMWFCFNVKIDWIISSRGRNNIFTSYDIQKLV